jgi:hypothetical protein
MDHQISAARSASFPSETWIFGQFWRNYIRLACAFTARWRAVS